MKRWYVLQIYSGYEDQILNDLEKRINDLREKNNEKYNQFGKILIPSVKTKQELNKMDVVNQQLFPGYMFIEMEMTSENINFILDTPRILRFLGGKVPFSLSDSEIEKIFDKVEGRVVISSKQEDFVVGNEVVINDGPFLGFVGIIEKIDSENENLTIMVSILGRMTPVELKFNKVKK
jgi:transcriptional antiterminator NusG